jgi:hypothetical protein
MWNYSLNGNVANPADITFIQASFTNAFVVTLFWPFAGQDSVPTTPPEFTNSSGVSALARFMFVQSGTPSTVALELPDATQGTVGWSTIFYNYGPYSIFLQDAERNEIATLAPGQVLMLVLKDDTVNDGTEWLIVNLGSGITQAQASQLAGLGLQASLGLLNVNLPVTAYSSNTFLNSTAQTSVWTGGSGTFTLEGSGSSGYFNLIRNAGSGTLTLSPSSGSYMVDGAVNITLNPGQSCIVVSDGVSNYYSIGLGSVTSGGDSRLSLNVSGSSNVTLTPTQAANDVMNFTGTLTGNIEVVCPTSVKNYFLTNATSGAFSLTFQTASGSGVSVSQGSSVIVTCDGTNVITSNTPSAGTVTNVTAGAGLQGGSITGSGTINLATISGFTPGVYGDALDIPAITLNQYGQATSASTFPLQELALFQRGSNVGTDGAAISGLVSLLPVDINTSSSAVITASNHGRIINNQGSTTPLAVSIPAPSSLSGSLSNGCIFGFYRQVEENITLNFSTACALYFNGQPHTSLALTESGSFIVVYGDGAGYWPVSYSPDALPSPIFTGSPMAPTPASDDSSKLIATTQFVNPANSIGSNGYYKLSNGIIEQWGQTNNIGAGASVATNFSTSFPNACFSVVITADVDTGEGATIPVTAKSPTNFTVKNNTGATQQFYYRAIGN